MSLNAENRVTPSDSIRAAEVRTRSLSDWSWREEAPLEEGGYRLLSRQALHTLAEGLNYEFIGVLHA